MEADIRPVGSSSPRYLAEYSGKLFFSADDGAGAGREPWSFDGTTATLEADIRPGLNAFSEPQYFTEYNGKLFFGVFDGGATGRELWSLSCPPIPPIPTMSQWGLFLFGLTIVSIGVVTLYNFRRRMVV